MDRDVLQRNLMEQNGGRAMENLEGLPHSLMAHLCGILHPALTGWKTEKKTKPLHLLKSSKQPGGSLSRIGGGLTRTALIRRWRTSTATSAWREANHVWAPQSRVTRKSPPGRLQFPDHPLEKRKEGKAKARLKAHLWQRAPMKTSGKRSQSGEIEVY
jgi:hypothetical protein